MNKGDQKSNLGAQFKGILHQPNISLCAGLLFELVVIGALIKYLYHTDRVFTLVMIAILVLSTLIFLGKYLWRTDSTESISLAPDGTVMIKSPSKQLIPALIARLTQTTSRPNKLIPQNIDLKDDPSKFQALTKIEGENIVKKEVQDAVLNHPLIGNQRQQLKN